MTRNNGIDGLAFAAPPRCMVWFPTGLSGDGCRSPVDSLACDSNMGIQNFEEVAKMKPGHNIKDMTMSTERNGAPAYTPWI